ncbi:HAD family hydrolase [Nitrolancea hollandica]|uniref:phosphoglycolate phosphatase n=1 Tax=Nitrolancea hollandica Lb TaxID=1129897 RepID=I4ELF4_9BACT|nr:HAD-IA family hydrolase [Nitrolancea hollandica]CCF85516.1 putative HAD-superfamily hydrolase [Nitrolancea hollandica Lb]
MRAIGRKLTDEELHAFAREGPVDALLALGVGEAKAFYERDFDRLLAEHADTLRVFEGVTSGMAELRAAGARLGIVTRQPRHRLALLVPPVVRELVDVLIARENVQRPKPAPDGIYLALQQLGKVPSERALFVGDTPHDIEAGRRAGVRVVGVSWGFCTREELAACGAEVCLNEPAEIGVRMLDYLNPKRRSEPVMERLLVGDP